MDFFKSLFGVSYKRKGITIVFAILAIFCFFEYETIILATGGISNSMKVAAEAVKSLDDNVTANGRSVSAADFKKITKEFRGAISAKTLVNAVSSVNKKYSNDYVSGAAISEALSSLSPESQKQIEDKLEKLIFTRNKITVKLKAGVPYIKLKNQTKDGKIVTIKISQGATIDITKRTNSQLEVSIKGTLLWMSINYADIGAVSVNTIKNTLSVYTKLGIGFWTTHEMGSLERRYQ